MSVAKREAVLKVRGLVSLPAGSGKPWDVKLAPLSAGSKCMPSLPTAGSCLCFPSEIVFVGLLCSGKQ